MSFTVTAAAFRGGMGGRLQHVTPAIEILPAAFSANWRFFGAEYDIEEENTEKTFQFTLHPDNTEIKGAVAVSSAKPGVSARYSFTASADVTLNSLFVTANLKAEEFIGGSWSCNDKHGDFPEAYDQLMLLRTECRKLQMQSADRQTTVTFTFPASTEILIQDNRQWSETFSLRIGKLNRFDFKQNESITVKFTVATSNDDTLKLQRAVTLTADENWIPLQVELDIADGSILDFSRLGFTDAPAGKHGRVIAKGGSFEFERKPDQPQRFYGINLCFSALYPENECADKIAERLRRIGYNSVRVHHYESVMTEGSSDGTQLNDEAMRKFDYFMAALINRGLYISTDLYVSRKVSWRAIGIDKPGNIPQDTFKKLVPVHAGAYNNLKAFTTALLSHVNPHTGRSYAQEPALAWINIINEGNFGNHFDEIKNIPEWQQEWSVWLKSKQRHEPALFNKIPPTIPENLDLSQPDPHKAAFLLFFKDHEIQMINKFKYLLREELGCHALISNANGWKHLLPDHFARAQTYDYIDEHFYIDHPRFIKQPWRLPSRCPNTNPIQNSNFGALPESYMRHYDKPFTISEYNYSAPGRFRGVGGILTGAMAALQEWSGLWRFAYSHNLDALCDQNAQPLNYFDMLNDPLSLAAERASLCLFLRSDIAPLKKRFAVHLPANRFRSPEERFTESKKLWPALGWSCKVGIQAGGDKPQGFDYTAEFPLVFEQYQTDRSVIPCIDATLEALVKANPVLKIDPQRGSFVIITEKTCGGFCESGILDADVIKINIQESAATVWISALDNRAIEQSGSLILTHLTDIQNSGIKYAEEERQTLLQWGKLPHLVRRGSAEIELRHQQADKCRVYALSTSGRRLYTLPIKVEDNILKFKLNSAGKDNQGVIIYEIVKNREFF